MTKKSILQNIFSGLIFVCLTASAAFAQTTAFTYQGKLTNNGTPATGSYEMRFTLEDVDAFQLGSPVTIPSVAVTQGIFTVELDFGTTYFDAADRFLKIEIRPAMQNPPPFTLLSPRQKITPAPKSLFSNSASFAVFSGVSANAQQLGGVAASQFVQKNAGGEIIAPRLENLANDPEAASAKNTGRVYFNTTTGSLRISNGTAWTDLTPASRRIQTFSGATASSNFNCTNTTTAIRTATFTKSSAASRLRITFKETASAFGPNSFTLFVSVRIGGVLVSSPTALRMAFASSGENGLFFLTDSFTAVGYADGVAAGTHTLTTTYSHTSLFGGSFTCYRSDEPYLIEIEEIP